MNPLSISLPEGTRRTSAWNPHQFISIRRRPNFFEVTSTGIDGVSATLQMIDHRVDFADISRHESASHRQDSSSLKWLFGKQTLLAIGPSGKLERSLSLSGLRDFDPFPDEEIGSALVTGDAIYLCVNRGVNNTSKQSPEHDLSSRLVKVSMTGELIWAIRLPVDKIEYDGVSYMSAETGWKAKSSPPWFPTTWKPFGHDLLLESGNRVMVRLAEVSSGVGRRYVVDGTSGELVWQSEHSAGGHSVSLGKGGFLIGDQGYGEFRTQLFKNDKIEKSWRSHGHSFSVGERFFSIQMANVSSQPQRCVEMKLDGSGADLSEPLGGYYTTRPHQLTDRAFYFWRNDAVWKWFPGDPVEVVLKTDFGKRAFATALRMSESRIGFHVRHGNEATMLICDIHK